LGGAARSSFFGGLAICADPGEWMSLESDLGPSPEQAGINKI